MMRPAMAIVCEVAEAHGLTPRDLLGRSRMRPITRARMTAYAEIRDRLGYSYPEIGMIFGRDHTTILHGVRQARKREERE